MAVREPGEDCVSLVLFGDRKLAHGQFTFIAGQRYRAVEIHLTGKWGV